MLQDFYSLAQDTRWCPACFYPSPSTTWHGVKALEGHHVNLKKPFNGLRPRKELLGGRKEIDFHPKAKPSIQINHFNMQAIKSTLLVVRPAGCLLTNLKSANDSYWLGATHCRIFTLHMSSKRVTFKKVLISTAKIL